MADVPKEIFYVIEVFDDDHRWKYIDNIVYVFTNYEDFLWNLADMRVRGADVCVTRDITGFIDPLGYLAPVKVTE